ncbi:hypothetical protein WJX77_009213 [Trebouxia sp. C0004]
MAPKKAEPAGKKVEPVQELPPSALELLLPTWSDAPAQQKPAPSDCEDSYDVPMRVGTPSASRALAGRLFAGHPSLRWLCACFVAVHELRDKLPPKGLLWELIFPQDASGQPTKTASGKYYVKCFVMDEWRRVTVDDRIPVDAYGAPLLVGSMPAQLWPLILSKAILKLMALYQVLDRPSWHQVAAFQWLTGWPQENLIDPLHGSSLMGSGLFERLHEACKQDDAPAAGHSTAVAHLKVQDRDSLQRPQFLVLCCASGLPVDEVMQQLVAQHPDSLGRIVTCTSRKPMEDEVQGRSYVFVPSASMQAGIAAGNFLETSESNGLHGSGMFGVSYDGVRDVAATGSVGVFRVDLQGVQALHSKHAVHAVYIHLRPASMEDWAHAQSLRLTESEATVQKRLAWAEQQSSAALMPGLFSCTIQDASPDAAYDGLKRAVAALSPFVRNKLQGLPADVLDYADLIASSSVEQAIFKPVVIAGPSVNSCEQLIQKLVEEFPQIFQAAARHATPAYGQDAPSPGQPTASDPDVILSTEDFKRLEGQGELVEQHSDPFTHVLARQRYGVTKGSIAAVSAAGKIPLLLTDVEGAQHAKADGLDCLSIFLAPASLQAFEAETREWLQRPQEALDAQIAAANADWDTAQSSTLFDHKLVFNNVDHTCDKLTQILTRHRPDLIHNREESDSSSPPAGPQLPGPLVMCTVAGPARETLITKLMQDYPCKFGTAIRHTSKKPEKGEVEGVHFFFVKKEVMQKMADGGQLAEFGEGPGGSLTGTAVATLHQVAAAGKMCVMALDVKRALTLSVPSALKVFLAPGTGLAQAVRAGLPPTTKEPQIQQAIQAATAEAERAKEAAASFAAVVPEGAMDAMYIALKQAISVHSPATVPPVSKPLVLAGPFGAACHKGELLQWLLKEYESSIALPEMVTTKPRQDGAMARSAFKVVTGEEVDALQAAGDLLFSEQACGYVYGVTKAAVQAVQYQDKVCLLDMDRASDVLALREKGFEACYIGLAPQSSQDMLRNIEAGLQQRPLPGYEPQDAAQQLLMAAEGEVAALQAPRVLDVAVSVGGTGPSALRQAFYRLMEQISLQYPQAVSMAQVWGYGRPSWDLAVRQHGQKPFRVMVIGPPLSGKTSHCQALSASLGLPLIQMGPLLQAQAAAGDAPLQEVLRGDGLIPDSMYLEAVSRRLQQQDCLEAGWLLDGFPHTLAQAEALQAAGHVPDHVIMLEAPQPVLVDRARHRLVDPVTHHIYHIPSVPGALSAPIAPTLPDKSPDAAVAARLAPRGDDSVPNVQHRLTVWTKHARCLSKKYADSSSRVSAVGDMAKVMANVREAVLSQSKLSQDISLVPCSSLISHHCQIVSVAKWHGSQVAELAQGIGKHVWVQLKDLASSSQAITLAQDPGVFSHSQQLRRSDLRLLAQTPALFLDCKDPVQLMVSLSGGPSPPVPPAAPDATSRQAPEFQLVVEPYAWGRTAEGIQGPLLRLHTPTAAAARLDLPAGRHLARLLTDNHSLHALDLRCNTPFQLEDLNKVLQEREGLALQKCEGRVGPYPPATWALWFRYTFKLSQPCRLGLDLVLPGEALLKAASLVLVDNDTSQETHFLVHRTQPVVLPANKEGYTVLAMSQGPEEVPQDSWRLSVLSQQPVQGWAPLPSARQDLFEGKYEANQYLILARYVMTPSQRTLLTLHGEVTNGQGDDDIACQVCISPIAEAAAQWRNDAQTSGRLESTCLAQSQLPHSLAVGGHQLALDPARCRCEIGQHGSLPWEVSWKLQLLPTAEAKACPVVPDDSKQKYSQASFAKWNEGQKDRPKQVNAALEGHKARIAAADAAAQQQKQAVTVRPVSKGKKEQPLELHPDQFVRIKAHKTAGNTSTSAAMLADLAEVTASPAVDVEDWVQTRAANKVAVETANQTRLAGFAIWRQHQLMQLHPEEG